MNADDYAAIENIVSKAVAPLTTEVHKLSVAINGPDDEPSKGMKVRLDRQEQIEKRRSFWIGTSMVVAFTALIEAMVSWVTGKRT
jgi:hypothetical protein